MKKTLLYTFMLFVTYLANAQNHFYDPLKTDWNEAGISDPYWKSKVITAYCKLNGMSVINSNLTWGARYTDKAPAGEKVATGNLWDWGWARWHYEREVGNEKKI